MEMQPGGQMPEANGLPADVQIAADYTVSPEITIEEGTSARTLENAYTIQANEATASEFITEPIERRLQAALQNICTTTDWGKVVEAYETDTKGVDLGLIKGILSIGIIAAKPEDENQRAEAMSSVGLLHKVLAKKDLFLPPNEQGKISEVTLPDEHAPEIGETWHTLHKQWSDAQPYLSPIHIDALLSHDPFRTFNKLQEGVSFYLGCTRDKEGDYSVATAMGIALERRSAELFDTFKSQEQALLDDVAPTPPQIEGLPLVKERAGISEEEIMHCVERHPETFRRGIKGISFVEELPGHGPEVDGFYVSLEQNICIKVSPKEDSAWTISKLHHELTHHAHNSRMPIEMLSEWHDITQKEDVNVTPYVAESREKEGGGHREDIADSGRLYFDYPGALLAIAPQRFAWFQKHYHRWSDKGVEGVRKKIEAWRAAQNKADDTKNN
jgi:hypothetical protein